MLKLRRLKEDPDDTFDAEALISDLSKIIKYAKTIDDDIDEIL